MITYNREGEEPYAENLHVRFCEGQADSNHSHYDVLTQYKMEREGMSSLVYSTDFMNLLGVRKEYGLSQVEASIILNMPVRTFIRYEKDDNYGSELKRQMMIKTLNEKCEITEDKGLLTVETIKAELTKLFNEEYKDEIDFCYLFGSYAKGYAKESSDVDLCVSTELTGLKFVGLSENIRNVLHKKIDLIRFSNLNNNIELINEIMKDGIKIYV